jgi:hypothetical protein
MRDFGDSGALRTLAQPDIPTAKSAYMHARRSARSIRRTWASMSRTLPECDITVKVVTNFLHVDAHVQREIIQRGCCCYYQRLPLSSSDAHAGPKDCDFESGVAAATLLSSSSRPPSTSTPPIPPPDPVAAVDSREGTLGVSCYLLELPKTF